MQYQRTWISSKIKMYRKSVPSRKMEQSLNNKQQNDNNVWDLFRYHVEIKTLPHRKGEKRNNH